MDSGYASAGNIVAASTDYGTALITPASLDNSAQARAGTGFAADNFTIDFKHQLATCPQGADNSSWSRPSSAATP